MSEGERRDFFKGLVGILNWGGGMMGGIVGGYVIWRVGEKRG